MSDDSNALIREIQEEVRRERLMQMWRRYGNMFVASAIIAVVVVGAWQWYIFYQQDHAEKTGNRFQTALNSLESADKAKQTEGADLLQAISKDGGAGYATLARLRLAAAAREAGKPADAEKQYEAVAKDNTYPLLASFAQLQIGSLKVDDGNWTEAQNRLTPLAADDSPWRHSARELLGLAAYKNQKWTEARQSYSSLLTDPTAPQDLRQRADIAMSLITRAEAAKKFVKKSPPPSEDQSTKDDQSLTKSGLPLKFDSPAATQDPATNTKKSTDPEPAKSEVPPAKSEVAPAKSELTPAKSATSPTAESASDGKSATPKSEGDKVSAPDLKNDKPTANGGENVKSGLSNAEDGAKANGNTSSPAPSQGAGAPNEADQKK